MRFTLLDLYSFSIAIAAVIGIIRFKKINPVFYPFIYLCWLAFATELLSYFLIYSGHSNAVNINIYILAEAVLIAWQMRNWGVFDRFPRLFSILLALFAVGWGYEVFVLSGIWQTITYFRVFNAFLVVLMSIDCLHRNLGRTRGILLKNPIILICLAFILYFSYTVVIGVFWMYGFGGSADFRRSMVWILNYMNVFANLVYALAILWMPKKLQYTLPY